MKASRHYWWQSPPDWRDYGYLRVRCNKDSILKRGFTKTYRVDFVWFTS